MRTRKTQIIEHLNKEKCETTRVEQRGSQLISRRFSQGFRLSEFWLVSTSRIPLTLL